MAIRVLLSAALVTIASSASSAQSRAGTLLVEQHSKAFLVDVATGREVEIAPGRGWRTEAAAWTPDGRHIVLLRVATGDRRSLWIAEASGLHPRPLTHPTNRGYGGDSGFWFSPDGTRLAFVRSTEATGGHIGVVTLADAHERIIGRAAGDLSGWTRDGHGLCLRRGYGPVPRFRAFRVSEGPIYPRTCRRRVWRRDGASLFVRGDRHGGSQIWIRSASRREWKLTNDLPRDPVARVANHAPAWSPDGSRVAFLSARSHGRDVYVIDVDGTHERRLTWKANALSASWSADGSTIAFLGSYPQTLLVVPAAGGPSRRVLDEPEEIEAADWQPPASTGQLAPLRPFHRRARRLRVLPGYLPKGHVRLEEVHRYGYQAEPLLVDMSPDGRFVSFFGGDARVGSYDLGVYDLVRGARRTLIRPPRGTNYAQVGGGYFSPNGRWILIRLRNELWLVSPMSGERRRLVDDANRGGGTWLHDGRIAYATLGRRLVFVSLGQTRRRQPFRIPNPPGPDSLDLAYSVSPDGTRVAYARDCGLWLRNLATGRSIRIARGEFSNVVGASSWSPDSSKFVAPNASWEKRCREFYEYPPSENRIFDRYGRRIGIAPGGGTTWSRDGRWLAVFNGEHGTNVGGLEPLDVVSFPDRHITSILRGGNVGPAFIGPGDRILHGEYAHPEVFGPPLETGVGAHPELWLGRLRRPS